MLVLHTVQGSAREGYGPDGAANDGRGSDMDVFGRKLSQIITADYTDIALAAGPLDIAGQVLAHAHTCCDLHPIDNPSCLSLAEV